MTFIGGGFDFDGLELDDNAQPKGLGTVTIDETEFNGETKLFSGDWGGGMNGLSTCTTFIQGEKFFHEGQYKDGKRHGTGKYTYPHGAVHEGEYKDDNRHGYGKVTKTNGDVYQSNWLGDERFGFVEYSLSSGGVYKGQISDDDQFHGYGTFTNQGATYTGQWSDDKLHGFAHYTCPDGVVYEGQWCDGKYTSPFIDTSILTNTEADDDENSRPHKKPRSESDPSASSDNIIMTPETIFPL